MRLNKSRFWIGEPSFNPRICKRCDINQFIFLTFFFVSIHASVKDATENGRISRVIGFEFQSTHL